MSFIGPFSLESKNSRKVDFLGSLGPFSPGALSQKPFLQKYVHGTTPEVYGSTDGGWIKEHNHFAPSTPYAVSRAACDLHLHSFHQAYGFPVVFTRAANVYGPGQQLYRIIPAPC